MTRSSEFQTSLTASDIKAGRVSPLTAAKKKLKLREAPI
jgi:hypothetical protein